MAKVPMRSVFVVLSFAFVFGLTPASAEKRMFIIGSSPDGYGVDRCLANGGPCGAAVASAYCRSQAFARATSYRKVDRGDVTGAVPSHEGSGCAGGVCATFVAIECLR
jgi:hypothetical protein